MATNKKYWKAIEELTNEPVVQKLKENEFAEDLPVGEFLGDKQSLDSSSTTRRDFLKFLGFSTAAATLAACEAPIVESIPYVVKPEELIPGMPNFYATTYFDGSDYASILVKTREGRPIKVEPNNDASFNGSTNARLQASVLSLYDSGRLRSPMKNGEEVSWDNALSDLKADLAKQADAGKEAVLLTGTVISPATKALIAEFGAMYPTFRHVTYDAFSVSGKLDFYEKLTGSRVMPTINLAEARLVVGMGADFLSDFGGQSLEKEYAQGRKPGADMARHIQIESTLSLTGSNADKRIKLKPSQQGSALVYLYNKVAGTSYTVKGLAANEQAALDKVAEELIANKGKAVVLAGGNSMETEAVCFALNQALGAVPTIVNTEVVSHLRQGNDAEVMQLIADMNAGKVGAIVMNGVNPVYSLSDTKGFAVAVEKVAVKAHFTDRLDETSGMMNYSLPVHHFLESWGDAMPTTNVYGLTQPTIRPLFDTMQFESALMNVLGLTGSYYDYVKANFNSQVTSADWDKVLHDGFAEVSGESLSFNMEAVSVADMASSISAAAGKANGFEIEFYQTTGIGNGTQANNPWLHELPDPITRITWDNYLMVSSADAKELGLINEYQSNGALNGSKVTLNINGGTLSNVPVLIQPGQTKGSMALAVGFGRTAAGKAGNNVGVNAYQLMNGSLWSSGLDITKEEGEHEFASVQIGHTMMGRKIVNEVTTDEYLNGSPADWNEKPVFETFKGPLGTEETNLWEDFDHETMPMWNMSIDLNSCTGCGACVVACHIENNVPVVGKEEVRKMRDMHWLRIDRYYSSDVTKETEGYEGLGGVMDMYSDMEEPSENPDVVFQPVMCQHCNHAPCETVCPVAATSHSSEGLNHMAYNRCIGTRYCANNCPYKVRRFNWFNYIGNEKFADVNPVQDEYGKMVINPDVTVRSRGVMEKCSLCIQRIQLGKLQAKKEGRPVGDQDVTMACEQACATGAFVFGNVNNPEAAVVDAKHDKRAYHLLEEVGTQPSVFYQTKVRNRS